MALLVGSALGQVPANAHILPQEDLAVLLQPVKHLGQKSPINIPPLLLSSCVLPFIILLAFIPSPSFLHLYILILCFSLLFFFFHCFSLSDCSHLLNILLKEPERQPLVQFDLLSVPLALQLSMVGQDLVDH